MRKALLLASLALAGGFSTAASATAAVTNTIFYFSGACTDCTIQAGRPITALAELTLSNYTLGQTITSSNFVSLHYDGTNLITGGFTIANADATLLAGSINAPLPGPENFTIGNGTYVFQTAPTGVWSVRPTVNQINTLDVGTGGSVSTNAAAAPEAASWAMMIAGFGMVGAALRRGRRVAVRFA